MTVSRTILCAAGAMLTLAACSKPATQTTAPPLQPVAATTAPATAPAAAYPATVTPATAQPVTTAEAGAPPPPPANGYSCTFAGPGRSSVLARFTLDGAAAHDDQGLAFSVLTNSPTALVLAHARDDANTAPTGDVGAYVVAIDRRTLGMVETTVGLNGPGETRRGHCIAG